jgi:hypothetical protein
MFTHSLIHSSPPDGNNERCTYTVLQTTQLTATEFNIRSSADYLTIGGTRYSSTSTNTINNAAITVNAGDQITW